MPSRSLLALLPALVLLLAACSDEPTAPGADDAAEPAEPTEPAVSTVALADIDTSDLVVPRVGLCDGLPVAAVEAALGGEARRSETWADGEEARLSAEVRDVAHEDGCRFDGPARTSAAAWVFTPPVSPARAEELAESALDGAGRRCRDVPDAAAYGDPSVAQTCRSGPLRETRYAGLVGDAWVTCSLSAPRSVERADLEERADRWCAAVLSGEV
ncbi:hypothetical protein BKA08_002284 [Nocardioides marinisabuli]|uniref:DUF3558 domain-containing protein n=1 Tax=Nocardioides marinisabuli TaxID=419476 RepID=A0A7Y9F2A6_9ACTN|nr:hypothetical protein [Nocardioides marinisabuli]NYD58046.1 hypothetical protein [Nocardioides marinisabuli]